MHANYPTMAMFGARSEWRYHDWTKHEPSVSAKPKSGHRKAASLMLNAAKTYRDFESWCRRSAHVVNIDIENVEALFCMAEALQGEKRLIKLNQGEVSAEEVLRQIKIWLWDMYRPYPPHDSPYRFAKAPYKKLIAELQQYEVTVLTTNYDVLFEIAAWEMKWKCWYPFDGKYTSLLAGRGTKEFVNLCKTRGPLVCKLHGSVNYFMGVDGNKFGVANIVSSADKVGLSPKMKGRPQINAADAIYELRERYGDQLVPAIVPPVYDKSEHTRDDWLKNIWRHAFEAVADADNLIFIGYSLPPTDGYMASMLKAAVASRETDRSLRVAVIDPSDTVTANYERVFRRGGSLADFRVIRETFVQAVSTPELIRRFLTKE